MVGSFAPSETVHGVALKTNSRSNNAHVLYLANGNFTAAALQVHLFVEYNETYLFRVRRKSINVIWKLSIDYHLSEVQNYLD